MNELVNSYWSLKDIEDNRLFNKLKQFLELKNLDFKKEIGLELIQNGDVKILSIIFDDIYNDFFDHLRYNQPSPVSTYLSHELAEIIHSKIFFVLQESPIGSLSQANASHMSALRLLMYLSKYKDLGFAVKFIDLNRDEDLFEKGLEVIEGISYSNCSDQLKEKIFLLIQPELEKDKSYILETCINIALIYELEQAIPYFEKLLLSEKIQNLEKKFLLQSLIASENKNIQKYFLSFIPAFISHQVDAQNKDFLNLEYFQKVYHFYSGSFSIEKELNSATDSYTKKELVDELLWIIEEFKIRLLSVIISRLFSSDKIDFKIKMYTCKKALKGEYTFSVLKEPILSFIEGCKGKLKFLDDQSLEKYDLEDFITDTTEAINDRQVINEAGKLGWWEAWRRS